jgi:hypothetical protein
MRSNRSFKPMFEITDDARIAGYRPLLPPAILME